MAQILNPHFTAFTRMDRQWTYPALTRHEPPVLSREWSVHQEPVITGCQTVYHIRSLLVRRPVVNMLKLPNITRDIFLTSDIDLRFL